MNQNHPPHRPQPITFSELTRRLDLIERKTQFLYDMLTRNGSSIDYSLVGVPGVDPFVTEKQPARPIR
jgi:hypothetical protein